MKHRGRILQVWFMKGMPSEPPTLGCPDPNSANLHLRSHRWFVEVSDSIAKQRLIDRHLRAGIETTRDAAEVRAESNDMRNAHLIRKRLVSPDVVIHN